MWMIKNPPKEMIKKKSVKMALGQAKAADYYTTVMQFQRLMNDGKTTTLLVQWAEG